MYTFIIKPTNKCNLRCRYCFIDEDIKSSSMVMSLDTAKLAINQIAVFLSEKSASECEILWHGGEPLIWCMENYDAIFRYMVESFPKVKWRNTMQTNLTLLDEQYIQLFKRYNVYLSTSMDGSEEIHDRTRLLANGKGSYSLLVDKLRLATKNRVNLGIIVVLNAKNIQYIIDIYNFFKKHNQGFKINPLVYTGEAFKNDELHITPKEYADAMVDLFDYWINDSDAVPISNFVEYASNLVTNCVSSCAFTENCQNVFTVIEPNGDVMACDRLCGEEKYVFGNISQQNLSVMYEKKRLMFSTRANMLKDSDCKCCDFWKICYGGCPTESIAGLGNLNRKTIYCDAYKVIFKHILHTLNNQVDL